MDKKVGITTVGVVGSGIMGAGIAEVAAKAGFTVVLRSRSKESLEAALTKTAKSLSRQVDKGKLSAEDAAATLGRIRGVTSLSDLEFCDLVIESVAEDLATKKHLFGQLDAACGADTILATNTSTLPVLELAVSVSRADRVCGMHFFNPAAVMPLVEIVPALTTSPETVEAAWAFALACGKTPVRCKDQAGFIVNALLFPYLNGAIRLLESGAASREDIDTAMRGGCGFPMGPFELLDLIGLDTSLSILDRLYAERREPGCVPAPLLRQMVTAQQLGRKTGGGFYPYPATPAKDARAPEGVNHPPAGAVKPINNGSGKGT